MNESLKACQHFAVGRFVASNHLNSTAAFQEFMFCQIDLAHPALTNQFEELVGAKMIALGNVFAQLAIDGTTEDRKSERNKNRCRMILQKHQRHLRIEQTELNRC